MFMHAFVQPYIHWSSYAYLLPLSAANNRLFDHFILNQEHVEYELGVQSKEEVANIFSLRQLYPVHHKCQK